MFVSRASSMTIRSMPGAEPPWGGAPNLNAFSIPPKRASTSSLPYPAMAKALYMMSGRWFRIAPLDSSSPLHTMSYWSALIVSGSCVSSAARPPCGIENGLWLNSIFPVSSFSSYIGKSVTQQKRNALASMRPSSSPSRTRTRPASFSTAGFLSQTKNTASPSRAPVAATSRPSRSPSRNFARGPFARPLPELVEEAPRLRRCPRRRHRADDGPRRHRRRERREARAAEDVGHVGDHDGIAEIGLVGPVLPHRLVERDSRERRRRHSGAVPELLEDALQDRLDRREDVLLRDEGHLEVELIELSRRAVGAAVLVAEAGRDLEVAVEPGGHQELLELLGRLRQRVELSGVYPARHQVVPGSLRRARREDRRLELDEARFDHPAPHRRDDAASQQDVPVELLAPQIEEAVAQARLLGKLGVGVDLERQGIRRRLHDQLGDRELDLAGRQLRVDRGGRARNDLARHGDHALEAQRLGDLEQRARAVEHALRDPVVVPEIEEQQAAVVALAVNPAREPNRGAGVLTPQLAAGVRPEVSHWVGPRPPPGAPAA